MRGGNLTQTKREGIIVNEKKHPPVRIFRFIALDSMAAYAAYYFFPVRGFCADADGNGKYHPVGIGQEREKDILDHLPGIFYLEHAVCLLGI